jgi:4-hydroxy-tetrahydrodipicolinate reductase
MSISVAVVGAGGKMGQLAIRLIEESHDLELHAAIGSADSLDGVAGADVVLDFTLPQASQLVVEHAVGLGISTVTGTSGWSAERIASLAPFVAKSPGVGVLVIPNFSLGSVLATSLAARAARYFDSIEIIEAHHAGKVDSPSGTAVRTAELIGEARENLGPVIAPHADQRARGQQVASVPIHSLRMQGVLAKQEVRLGGTGELLTITHETLSSDSYESGILLALRAAPGIEGVVVGLDKLLEDL